MTPPAASTPSWRQVVILVSTLLMFVGGCGKREPAHTLVFHSFGTTIELTLLGIDKATAEAAQKTLEEDFAQMETAWASGNNTPLGRVNNLLDTGKAFAAPPAVLTLIQRGRELAEQSGNLFNPAIGKLVDLWGFGNTAATQRKPPAAEDIEKLVKANPRLRDLDINGIMLRCNNPEVKLNFSAFGKGYGIDQAMEHLKQLGVKNALLNAGGDLRAIGSRDGLPWRIAIRRPSGAGVFAILYPREDESLFTSGDYQRNFVFEGKRYHHIIDPRTGFPATGTRSVTVVHSNATVADAAATALFIAGPDRWHEIAKRMGIGYVVLVDDKGVLHMNPEMAERIELLDKDASIQLSAPLLDASSE